MLTRRRQVAAKIESNEGGAETLAAAQAKLLVYEPKFEIDPAEFKRDPSKASLSNAASTFGIKIARLTFKVELKGSGTNTTAPSWGVLLRACGFGESIGASSVTYTPASTSIASLTMALYADGVIKKMQGARGTVKMVHKTGEPIMLEFEFLGVLTSVYDGALLESVEYEDTIPPKFMNASLLLHTYAAILSALEFDIGNTLAIREDSNSSGGMISAVITKREPKGSCDPEMVTIGTHDFFGIWDAETLAAFTETIGSVAGNKFVITAPKVQYAKIDDGDRDGIATAGLTFNLVRSSGDDEFSIVQQ